MRRVVVVVAAVASILGASNGSVVHQRTDALIANVTSASGLWGTSWTRAVVPTAD